MKYELSFGLGHLTRKSGSYDKSISEHTCHFVDNVFVEPNETKFKPYVEAKPPTRMLWWLILPMLGRAILEIPLKPKRPVQARRLCSSSNQFLGTIMVI